MPYPKIKKEYLTINNKIKVKKLLIVISSMFFLGHSSLVGAELQVQVTKSSEWDSGFCSTVSVYNPWGYSSP